MYSIVVDSKLSKLKIFIFFPREEFLDFFKFDDGQFKRNYLIEFFLLSNVEVVFIPLDEHRVQRVAARAMYTLHKNSAAPWGARRDVLSPWPVFVLHVWPWHICGGQTVLFQ